MKKNIREIIENHTYILMSCISSLLMIDHCVLSSPQWCSGVLSALETGVQVRLMSSVGRLLSLFYANYKVKHNLCDDFIRCLDGALISSEVNTLNNSGSNPCIKVDWGTNGVFYWSTWKKHEG